MSRRFFSPTLFKVGQICSLDPQRSHHISKVLRLKIGEKVILFNGNGINYLAELTSCKSNQSHSEVEAVILSEKHAVNESKIPILLACALSKLDKMELIVQKSTELGVNFIQPLVTMRSERIDEINKLNRKLEHWRSIALSSCEQSGRSTLPLIMAPISLNHYFKTGIDRSSMLNYTQFQLDYYSNLLKYYNISLNLDKKSKDGGFIYSNDSIITKIFFDGESKNSLSHNIGQKDSFFHLATGPEGGFDLSEKELFINNKWTTSSLGPRILRSETAPIAAIVALQCFVGDIL